MLLMHPQGFDKIPSMLRVLWIELFLPLDHRGDHFIRVATGQFQPGSITFGQSR